MTNETAPAADADLPSAEDAVTTAKPKGKGKSTPAPAAAEETAPAADADLRPLFNVSARGFEPKSFHADDESDAARQFYSFHGVTETDKHQHRVERIS